MGAPGRGSKFGAGEESAAEMGMFQEQWEIPQCGVPGSQCRGTDSDYRARGTDSTTWVLEEEGVSELEDTSVLRHVLI